MGGVPTVVLESTGPDRSQITTVSQAAPTTDTGLRTRSALGWLKSLSEYDTTMHI